MSHSEIRDELGKSSSIAAYAARVSPFYNRASLHKHPEGISGFDFDAKRKANTGHATNLQLRIKQFLGRKGDYVDLSALPKGR